MKKNKILPIIIIVIGLLMIGTAFFLSVQNKEEKKEMPKKEQEAQTIDITKDMLGKTMIYVAETKGYTTENYLIDIKLENNNYVATVKAKDGQLVETITVSSETIKSWQPNNSSPEGAEVVEAPDFSGKINRADTP